MPAIDAPHLPATAYVVLGLVSLRPTAGHELAGFAERSVGYFFPLTRSHLYTELDRLCTAGLLEATEVHQEKLPTKRVYEITPAGADALKDWLDESAVVPVRHRNLLLVRVFFGDRMSPGRIDALLDEFVADTIARRDRLSAIVDRLADRPEAVFRRSTAMFGVRYEQANLDWVDEIRPILSTAGAPRSQRPGCGPPARSR